MATLILEFSGAPLLVGDRDRLMRILSFLSSPRPIGTTPEHGSLAVMFGVLVFLLSLIVAGLAFLSGQDASSAHEEAPLRVVIPSEISNWGSPLIPLQGIRAADTPNTTAKVLAVQQALKHFSDVVRVEPVQPSDLPLPREKGTNSGHASFAPVTITLAVFLKAGASVTPSEIQASLRRIAPDIAVEETPKVPTLNVRAGIIAVGGILLMGLILVVILVTRASLRASYATLDTLRLMGARNGYVSKIFQRQILKAALIGGGVGVLLAAPVLGAFFSALNLGEHAATDGSLLHRCVGAVLVVPVGVALVSVLVSRLTVLQHLRRLDDQR